MTSSYHTVRDVTVDAASERHVAFASVICREHRRRRIRRSVHLRLHFQLADVIMIIIIIFINSALQARVIQCWRRDALSGVVQRWPSTVSTDAVQLVNCSKSQDRKQRSSSDQWLWLSVARRVCRKRPTAGVDVLWDERPAGRAHWDTGVLGPADNFVDQHRDLVLYPLGDRKPLL